MGLAMYLDMLEQAVQALKAGREPALDRPLAAVSEMELHVPALLPETTSRTCMCGLALYKRIAAADAGGLEELTAETHRPLRRAARSAANLLQVARLRLRARELGMRRLDLGAGGGYVLFEEKNSLDTSLIIRLIQKSPKELRLEGSLKLRVTSQLAAVEKRFDYCTGSAAALQWPQRVIELRHESASPGARISCRLACLSACPLWGISLAQQPSSAPAAAARQRSGRTASGRRRGAGGTHGLQCRTHRLSHQRHAGHPGELGYGERQAPAAPAAGDGESAAPVSEAAATSGRFVRALTPGEFQLADLEARLKASGSYVPVAHVGWAQTASPWGTHQSMSLQQLGFDNPLLSGTVTLERGQFLHLGLALNLTIATPPAGLGAAPQTTFVLSDNHRVKFYERNYYDAPAFGVIALVVPAQGARRAGR